MTFKYRHGTLLSYRQHLKEKAGIELSRARQQLINAQESLGYYKETLQQANKYLESDLKNRIYTYELKNHSDYITGLKDRIETQIQEVAEWEKVVSERLENLLKKSKDFRIIEKLKEKDFKEWNHQQRLLELKRMNEVAVIRYGRQFL